MKNPTLPALTLMGTISALAFLGAAPLAHAATPSWAKIWTPDSVTACKRLPLSEWGICKAEVVARERGSTAAVQQQYPASYTAAIARLRPPAFASAGHLQGRCIDAGSTADGLGEAGVRKVDGEQRARYAIRQGA